MFRHLAEPTKAAVYYAIAFALALVVALIPIPEDPKPLLTMFTPAGAVLAVLFVVTRDGRTRAAWADLGLHRSGVRRWPAAVLVPLLLIGGVYGIAWVTGALALADGLDGQRLLVMAAEAVLGVGIATATYALGEELGWSGYLLPRLAPRGQERASALRGLLHALWHFPLIFLTGTYLAEGDRLITVPLFVVTLTCAGFAYGYLRFTTNSVWPGTIAHAAFNQLSATFAGLTAPADPERAAYLVGEGGGLTAAGAILMAAWAVWRLRVHARSLQPASPVPALNAVPAPQPRPTS